MGISLDQYRSSIGKWNNKKLRQPSPTQSKYVNSADIQSENQETQSNLRIRLGIQWSWKTYMLIVLVILSLPCLSLASPDSDIPVQTYECMPNNEIEIYYLGNSDTSYFTVIPPESDHFDHPLQMTKGNKTCTHIIGTVLEYHPQTLPYDQVNYTSATHQDTLPNSALILPYQCQRLLLLMAGIESHPGPTQEEVLADLCLNAPSNEIRDCLRSYTLGTSMNELHRTIKSKNNRAALENTLIYLEAKIDISKYNVDGLAYQLIYRIENFLPEMCRHCNQEYCDKIGETPLLSCHVCGQGAHTSCVFDLLSIDSADRGTFTPDEALAKINPLMLPELHYLCTGCVESYLPDKTEGLKKKAKDEHNRQRTTSVAAQPADETDDGDGETTNDRTENPPDSNRESAPDDNEQQQNTQNQNPTVQQIDICTYYKRGVCRYGISGRQCPKNHPKACKKLLEHGNRGPRGCTAGRSCDKFHPIMCQSSLRKRECFNEDCKLVHISGTKRVRPLPQNPRDFSPRFRDRYTNQQERHFQPYPNQGEYEEDFPALNQHESYPRNDRLRGQNPNPQPDHQRGQNANPQLDRQRGQSQNPQLDPFLEMLQTFKREILLEVNSHLSTLTRNSTSQQPQRTNAGWEQYPEEENLYRGNHQQQPYHQSRTQGGAQVPVGPFYRC